MVEDIKVLWEKHESTPIPAGFRAIVVNGITVTQLHCDIAANILTYINTGGRLGAHRIDSLVKTRKSLDDSLDKIPTESKNYLQNLKKISDLVLKDLQ